MALAINIADCLTVFTVDSRWYDELVSGINLWIHAHCESFVYSFVIEVYQHKLRQSFCDLYCTESHFRQWSSLTRYVAVKLLSRLDQVCLHLGASQQLAIRLFRWVRWMISFSITQLMDTVYYEHRWEINTNHDLTASGDVKDLKIDVILNWQCFFQSMYSVSQKNGPLLHFQITPKNLFQCEQFMVHCACHAVDIKYSKYIF